MKIGYARANVHNQNLDLQLEALKEAGCERIYQDEQNLLKERPQLDRMISELRSGDVVVTFNLNKIGKSLKHLLNIINLFTDKKIQFVSINDNIDTTNIQGSLLFKYIINLLIECQQVLNRERTMVGLKAARDNGKIGGKKKGLSEIAKEKAYSTWLITQNTDHSVSDIIKLLNISRATYYRYLKFVEESKYSALKK